MPGCRLLVTGATGFVGTWVLRHWGAAHPDVEIWGTSEQPCPARTPATHYEQVDLRDAEAVRALVRAARPSLVVHLAGLIGQAGLAEHLAVNVVGTDNLYAALAEADLSPGPRIVQASSAATYGLVRPEELRIPDTSSLHSSSILSGAFMPSSPLGSWFVLFGSCPSSGSASRPPLLVLRLLAPDRCSGSEWWR